MTPEERKHAAHIASYRYADGLYPGTLAEAGDRMRWAMLRIYVHAAVRPIRRLLARGEQ